MPKLFEPVRLKFFVPPAVPQNILFFLLEETEPTASVITLAAVHPKAPRTKKCLPFPSGERQGLEGGHGLQGPAGRADLQDRLLWTSALQAILIHFAAVRGLDGWS